MPKYEMNFFTPSDLLRLEQDTSNYIQMVRQSMVGSRSDERYLNIDLKLVEGRKAYVVSHAGWHLIMSDNYRDVLQCFQGPKQLGFIEVPSNMNWKEYLELLFLKVSNGFGGELVLDTRSLWRNRVTFNKSS